MLHPRVLENKAGESIHIDPQYNFECCPSCPAYVRADQYRNPKCSRYSCRLYYSVDGIVRTLKCIKEFGGCKAGDIWQEL
jgi:hypothetical protein